MSCGRERARRQGADWLRYQTPDSDVNPELEILSSLSESYMN
jgi:hypothetical protein